jgi:hypothetical protein
LIVEEQVLLARRAHERPPFLSYAGCEPETRPVRRDGLDDPYGMEAVPPARLLQEVCRRPRLPGKGTQNGVRVVLSSDWGWGAEARAMRSQVARNVKKMAGGRSG